MKRIYAELLKSVLNRRMLTILLLGFSSGLPLALVSSTLQAWMASVHVDLSLIGVFSLVGLPYTLKFLWAPWMDRYSLFFLGRRRGWIFITQVALIFSLVGMSFADPIKKPGILAIFAFLVAFSSASQDIVIDAYKTEILNQSEFGLGASVANLGYRLALLFSGAFALILSDHISWQKIYLMMAGSISVGFFANLFGPESPSFSIAPKTLQEALVEPFLNFFQRKKILGLVAFIIFYKMDVVVALALMTPFMMEIGFTKTDIGIVNKGFGLISTLVGTFLGGLWMSRIGLKYALFLFGILQGISGICFYLLARMGHHYPMMVITIASENFFSGMGNAAYAAFLMSLCHPKFTATQFALLTSLMALTRTFAGSFTGFLAKAVGWNSYFLIAILLMIPGLYLLTYFDDWMDR